MREAIPSDRRKEPGAGVELASSCWERGCAHPLHRASSVGNGASNSPRRQGQETLYVPKVPNAVQRPDAIMRENGGVGCRVVLVLAAGLWRNGRNEKKEEAMLRKYTKTVISNLVNRGRDFSSNS
jgi:hypothetical protein